MNNIKIQEKYMATFILHAVGDTLGFKNGEWEFNYNKETDLDSIYEFIYDFIDLGGINGINLKDWIISDDTIYHIATANGFYKFYGNYFNQENNEQIINEKFIECLKDELILMHNRLVLEEKKDIYRYPGKATEKYIQKFTEISDGRNLPYDETSGGNGAAMKNLCIGLLFNTKKENELVQLADLAIITSKLTHNSPIGFLGGLTTAYFTSLAIHNVNIEKWPFLLLKLINSNIVKKHIDINNNNILMDYIMFIRQWNRYIETKFIDQKPIKSRANKNLILRIKNYFENFHRDSKSDWFGGDGACATIIAYDSLLDCEGYWEKLVFYSILHPGDSDTIGAIAGGLYGAYYGFGDVPKNMTEHLEESDTLTKLGKKFYKLIN
jgi:ADP-ribosylglycohydrolase